MNKKLLKLPEGVRLPQKYRHTLVFQAWFLEGAHDGVAGFAYGHDGRAEFVRQYGQSAWTAYAEGYNEGRAARNTRSE